MAVENTDTSEAAALDDTRAWDDHALELEAGGVVYTGRFRKVTLRQLRAGRAVRKDGATLLEIAEIAESFIDELCAGGEPVEAQDVPLDDLLELYLEHPFLSGARRGPGANGDRPDRGGGPSQSDSDAPAVGGVPDGMGAAHDA